MLSRDHVVDLESFRVGRLKRVAVFTAMLSPVPNRLVHLIAHRYSRGRNVRATFLDRQTRLGLQQRQQVADIDVSVEFFLLRLGQGSVLRLGG